MKKALGILALAIAVVISASWFISRTWNLSLWHGFYCSSATALTVGCDKYPPSLSGQVVTVVLMLVAVPLFAIAFSLLTSIHIHKRINKSMDEKLDHHHERIMASIRKDADERKETSESGSIPVSS